MEINVNNNLLDVTIEKEKFLGEIIPQIENWLYDSKMHLKEMQIDGNPVRLDLPDTWNKTEISSIEKLDITAISNMEKYVEDLQVVYQYVSMLDKAIESENFALAEDLLKDREIIAGTLDYFFSGNDKKIYSRQLLELTENQNNLKTPGLKDFLDQISFLLQKRIGEITAPVKNLTTVAASLKDLIPGISDVSILLQTGKDREAFSSVLAFIELSQTLIRIFSILRETGILDMSAIELDGVSLDSFYTGFNQILKELAEAFDSSDTVLIGDLLEYEIVPKIDTLLEFISKIERDQE